MTAGTETAVVITCFGLGRWLPEAIESVLAQTAPARELVVVDDGSDDALTLQALDWIERHEPRVQLIRAEHGGPAAARNAGIAATSAPLVVLLDGDDLFEPSYLEQASRLLREREDLSFVCCALHAFGRASYRWKPPPYTVAEALGRGACGHISTVFRREVWEHGPQFDPSLPAYEDVDFWLGALRRGLRGAILDDVLVRYRVRQGSRYHSAVVRGDYLRAKELLLDRHLVGSRARGEDVLVTLLDFERELTGHVASLRDEHARLEAALDETEREIEQTRDALAARELPALRWSRPQPSAPGAVERHLLERMLRELCPGDVAPRRTLRIGPSDAWPAEQKPAYELVVLAGALEREPDPAAALDRARALLRPGGRLVVAAATSARGEGRQHGFTQASMRRLLCERFPPGEVRVAADGNLMTSLCALADAPLDALAPAELETVDPTHATIVAGVARLPGAPARGLRRRPAPAHDDARTPPFGTAGDPPPRAAILCYHRVAALRPDVHHLCTPPERFAAHMQLLAARFRPVPLAQLAAEAAAGELRPGTVAVTFDDGYLDNLEVASPIAAELEIPVTFFVSGTPSDEPREAWWDTVERILLGDEPIPETLSLGLPDETLELRTHSELERRAALHALHARLLHAEPARIDALVAAVAAWSELDLAPRRSHRLMTAPELVELAAHPGHAIGAHGVHHLLLPSHERAVQAHELGGSQAALERILDAPVELLAYPYGGCDVTTADVAGELGFTVACTVEPEAVHADSDPLRLPRIELRDEDAEQLRLRLEQTVGARR
jgi:glycosyltransferase involved in cell wall biosynthesis/peptidoglycan/xylan/chitin deacetylase (PgdA/CDA1 family)